MHDHSRLYECPWCTHKTFSFWQKQGLGPNRTIACGGCTRRVSVPWGRAHLAALPVFLCAVVGLYAFGAVYESKLLALAGGFIGVAIGMVLTAPLYHRFVPLVRPAR
jgi:hypothetical protein